MKSRFFAVAFGVLFLHQVGRFIVSLNGLLERSELQARSVDSDEGDGYEYNQEFRLSQFADVTVQDERKIRKSNLQVGCAASRSPKSFKDLNSKEQNVLLKHIIVSDKYKFLYCYTPKVACSNWKRVVMVLEGVADDFVRDHPYGLTYLSEYNKKEVEKRLQTYYKFAFVRNPLERLLSAYRNKFGEIENVMRSYGSKIKQKYKKHRKPEEKYDGKIPGDDVSFEEFIRFLIDEPSLENMNEHWAPISTLCQPCVVNYDFIGSYDNLYEDSEEILKEINAPPTLHFPARQSFYSPTSYAATAYYYSLINATYLNQFYGRYAKDFTLLSYPFAKIK